MTYKELKERVLQLLNTYSRNGTFIDNLYNDQSDYLMRIPGLYNSAMTDIAVAGKEFVGVIDWGAIDVEDYSMGKCIMTVPDDFIRMRPVLLDTRDGAYYSGEFYPIGEDRLIIDKRLVGKFLTYNRFPRKLDTTPGADIDRIRLDGDAEQQEAAILYIAARLVVNEDSFAYSSFMNEYDERRGNMKRLSAEVVHVPDFYGAGGILGYES